MPNTQGVPPDVLPNSTVLWDDKKREATPEFRGIPVSGDPFTLDPGTLDPDYARMQSGFGRGAATVAKNAIKSIWDFVRVPGDVAAGKYSLDEISRMAPGYALGLAGAGTPIGAAIVPEEALGIFGGTKSLTAPRAALSQAESLERLGMSRDDIHLLTGGVFRGPEGKWRYPISDEGAYLNLAAFRPNRQAPGLVGLRPGETTLSNVLVHPGGLFEAYPELGKYPVGLASPNDIINNISGTFYPKDKRFTLAGGKSENILSTLLHETQHGIQDIEGFAPGGAIRFPPDFAMRAMQLKAKRAAFLKVLGEVHPELSGEGVNSIKNLLGGYPPSRQTVQTIQGLHPALQEELRPLAYEAGALRNQSTAAYDKYKRLAGEVEARAVEEQNRLGDWTTPVWQHQGYVPFEDQIVKTPVEHDPFAPAKLSLVPVDHNPFEQPTK